MNKTTINKTTINKATTKWEYFVSKIQYVGVLNRACLWSDSAGRSLLIPQEEWGVSKEAMANFLNILGKEGWELIAVHEGHYVFKRPKAPV